MRKLVYIADPMCAWCYGFGPVLATLRAELSRDVGFELALGGLAPDTDEPMPQQIRAYVQAAWKAVEARTGLAFERAFWERCEPRRSTYPACRAVVAARAQDAALGEALFAAIQRAYYREARNPSLDETLLALAEELAASKGDAATGRDSPPPLDLDRFRTDFSEGRAQELLTRDLARRDTFGPVGFPSLALEDGPTRRLLVPGYLELAEARAALAEAGLLNRT